MQGARFLSIIFNRKLSNVRISSYHPGVLQPLGFVLCQLSILAPFQDFFLNFKMQKSWACSSTLKVSRGYNCAITYSSFLLKMRIFRLQNSRKYDPIQCAPG